MQALDHYKNVFYVENKQRPLLPIVKENIKMKNNEHPLELVFLSKSNLFSFNNTHKDIVEKYGEHSLIKTSTS